MSINIPKKRKYVLTISMSAYLSAIIPKNKAITLIEYRVKIYNKHDTKAREGINMGKVKVPIRSDTCEKEKKNTRMLLNPLDSQTNSQYECGHQVYPVIPARPP